MYNKNLFCQFFKNCIVYKINKKYFSQIFLKFILKVVLFIKLSKQNIFINFLQKVLNKHILLTFPKSFL